MAHAMRMYADWLRGELETKYAQHGQPPKDS